MAGGFSINAMLNASKFLRGVDDIDGALQDLEGSLDDVADEVKKLDRTGGFKDLAKEADKAEDKASDLEKRLRKVRDEAGDIGDKAKPAFNKFSDAGKEASDELKQNLGETFSSFRGDLEDLPQVAQDVLGGLAGSFGGLPAALGLAGAAAGIGVLIESFTKITEAANEARDSAFDMAYSVSGAIDAAGYDQRLAEWTSQTEKWKQANDIAQATGWDVVDVVDALASGGSKLDDLTGAWGEGADAAWLTSGRLWELEAVMKATNEGYASGAEAADINARALSNYASAVGVAAGETDDLGNAIYELPDKTQVVVEAETGRAYANVDALEQNINGVQGKTVAVNADTSNANSNLNRWISQNDGRTIKVYGRYISPAGSNVP